MNHDQLLASVGRDWRELGRPPEGARIPSKFMERDRQLDSKHDIARRFLPEYTSGQGRMVVDFSCGNGAFLEVMRAYGHEVLGVEVQYLHFMESQGIPVVLHDCRTLPYPLPSKSADLVSCQGAITFYGDQPWTGILDEFARIARTTILVIANHGHVLEQNRAAIEGWLFPGWRPAWRDSNAFKWVRE